MDVETDIIQICNFRTLAVLLYMHITVKLGCNLTGSKVNSVRNTLRSEVTSLRHRDLIEI